jgi:transcription antitermination factor NusG
MTHWFVLWVLTGKELDVLRKLRQTPGAQEALVPMEAIYYRREGAWEERESTLIPGYVFLRCRMDSAIYYRIREIPHVIGWLGTDSMWPTIVPPEEMDPILKIGLGEDPAKLLQNVSIDKHKRRGRGTLRLCGTEQRIIFTPRDQWKDQKQAEDERVDKGPADGEAEQNPEESQQADQA